MPLESANESPSSPVRGEWGWTLPRVAKAGDPMLFYLLKPEGQFAATDRLLSDVPPGSAREGSGRSVTDVQAKHASAEMRDLYPLYPGSVLS